ncbi:MAG: exodeoxyribonuclease VII large subunit [Planctomycetota bacterium]|jgi:exodeoxyribonuclease VII large subunit
MTEKRPSFDPHRIVPQDKTSSAPGTISVTHLNTLIKRVLTDHLPSTIHLIGEISNLTRPTSGHLYLTLKDQNSEIRAVMWRSAASTLKFKPADGMKVVATGRVDLYQPRGQYQFYIRKLQPSGVGALELAFRQMRDRLTREGLFDPKHKKNIPPYPKQIAIVTSPTGAAIRDIIKTIRSRYPCVSIILHPVRVQGEGAADQIARAVQRLNRFSQTLGGIDCIIAGRGGGSLEDLWAFNEESVARAIYQSEIPVISAVGHEVDLTIADLVADVRAPTPTAAGEIVIPILNEVIKLLANQSAKLYRAVGHELDNKQARFQTLERSELFRDPIAIIHHVEQQLDEIASRLRLRGSQKLANNQQKLHQVEIALAKISPKHLLNMDCQKITQSSRNLNRAVIHRMQSARQILESFGARLDATSYRQTLARGYTITRTGDGRKIITSPQQVQTGDKILTQTSKGEFESQITKAKGE